MRVKIDVTKTIKTFQLFSSGGVWFEELKFNKHCSTFVLFNKNFSILN
jgi:hypothetical protein